MKYFRNDLWDDINSLDIEKSKRAKDKWEASAEVYWEQYDRLMSTRLNEKTFNALNDNKFHDCRVIECKITQGDIQFPYSSSFAIVVEFGDEDWIIEYRKVISLSIHIYEDFNGRSNGFEEWGYHELLPVNDRMLSHEILFSSGATIKVTFLDKDINIRQT
ncbi:hypothetical protein ACFSTH_07145 [Paenibacillus yanchengensis]|uniref:DUF4085 family protein n=1 Tax=Paenibacillus yanchengensis TaxID=2035833 RepID=A0ABW4YHW7_9BACL